MKVLLVFILSLLVFQVHASDFSGCGDYFLVGEVVQRENDDVQFLVNKSSISEFKLQVKNIDTLVSLIALEGQVIKVRAKIPKRVTNYVGEIEGVEDIQVLLPPQYKISNSIELLTKKECQE